MNFHTPCGYYYSLPLLCYPYLWNFPQLQSQNITPPIPFALLLPLSASHGDSLKEIVRPLTLSLARATHARREGEEEKQSKMHSSLTTKRFMDSSPGHYPVRAPRPSQSWVNPGPRRVVVTCSLEENGGGSTSGPGPIDSTPSFRSRSQTYALLKKQMEVAAQSEDYEEAARIRDSLKLFEEGEPLLRLRRLLKLAVEDDRFEDAAKYRDELKEIEPHSLLKCSSDATTLGIRVQVRSVYIEGRSQPSKGQYFFAYRIRITNISDRPVQLLRRHWIITNANGKTENFWGNGVIGEQPVILPSTGFEYSSACPLATPDGRMEGEFELKHIDKVGARTFNVAIAPFRLAIPGDESRVF